MLWEMCIYIYIHIFLIYIHIYIRNNLSTDSYLRGVGKVHYFLLYVSNKVWQHFFFIKAWRGEGIPISIFQSVMAGCEFPQPKAHPLREADVSVSDRPSENIWKMLGLFLFSKNKVKETCTRSFSWNSTSEGVLWVWKERGLSRLSSHEQWELFWTTLSSQVCSSSKSSTSLLATFHSKNCKKKGRFTGGRRGLWCADTCKRSWCYSAASSHHAFI